MTKAFERIKNIIIAKTYDLQKVVILSVDSTLEPEEAQQRKAILFNALQSEHKEATSAYISARIYQLCGDYEHALIYYKRAKSKTINGLLGKYAEGFSRRLEGKDILCAP